MPSPHMPGGLNNGQPSKKRNSSLSTLDRSPTSDSLDNKRMMDGFFGKTMDVKNKKKALGRAFASWKGALVKPVEIDDLSRDDIIIAVMGPTGSGKSTFIDTITGLGIGVGHNLNSCTSEISTVRFSVPEVAYGDLVFVDTPGFDDTNKSDVDILKMIADWLKSTYTKGVILSGLLYFHRISDNRMAGTPLRNLRMFEELCGKNAFENVVLVTTMWDEVHEGEGEAREQQLKSKYWRAMLTRGSSTSRFLRTRESAFSLVDPFIEVANKRISVLLQQEMVDMSRELPATSAGHELYSKMEFLVRQRQELLDRIRNEMKRAEGDNMALEPLQEEHEKLRISLEATVNKMRELKLPLSKRLVQMADKFFGIKFTFTFFKAKPSKDVSFPEDVIIALIGPTGSGKSSFINTISLEIGIANNLESCAHEVRGVRYSFPELAYGDLVFVDTPGLGFDDEHKSHADVLKMVTDWLKITYGKDTLLSGVLYFHQITDNWTHSIPGPLKDLRRFEKLCGKNSFQNAILVTTMWDGIEEKEGEAREQQLKSKYWRTMLERGSTTSRFMRTRESAFAVIDPFIGVENKRILDLLQQEMVNTKSKQLPTISTGHELYSKVELIVRQRQALLERVRNGMRTNGDPMALEPLQREHKKLRFDLEVAVNEMQKLNLPLGKRHVQMAEKCTKSTSTLFNFTLSSPSKGDSSPDDIIIAVMGRSRSGKSTFINTISGLETSMKSNGESCTHEVRGFRCSFPELAYGDLVFVDTPEFDDTSESHVDVLKRVANWLKTTYAKNTLLSGVLYFHRITDKEIENTAGPLKYLQGFETLCGKNSFQNVILATTMWDEAIDEEGEAQERELKSKYWRPLLDRGSMTSRFMRTRESAFAVVDPFIVTANKRISDLLQQEMVNMKGQHPATSAGHELYSKMELLVRQRQELFDQVLNDLTRADGGKIALEPLQQEHEKLQIKLQATVNEMRELKLPLGERLLKMTDRFIGIPSHQSLIQLLPTQPTGSLIRTVQVV